MGKYNLSVISDLAKICRDKEIAELTVDDIKIVMQPSRPSYPEEEEQEPDVKVGKDDNEDVKFSNDYLVNNPPQF